jgi:hypothetical protein
MERTADMTTIDGLSEGLSQTRPVARSSNVLIGTPDGTYCPSCGGVRRMHVQPLSRASNPTRVVQGPARNANDMSDEKNLPAIFRLACVQCSEIIILVAYAGPGGPEVVALPSTYGGLSTPNSPDGVKYYLDQAERSFAVGAHTAAMTMYRSALEQILLEQGYTPRMLGPKIKKLEKDPNPPKWYRDLDPEFLDVIRKLGNLATHAGEGDAREQEGFDRGLIGEVRALFVELLDDIYEHPARSATRLRKMKQATGSE